MTTGANPKDVLWFKKYKRGDRVVHKDENGRERYAVVGSRHKGQTLVPIYTVRATKVSRVEPETLRPVSKGDYLR